MAGNTFSVRASFDGTELVQGFQDVKSELNGLKTAGDNAGKSLGQMLQQKNSTSNYSRQLGQIKQQLTDLAVNYSKLSDAEKNSDFGVAMAARIDELTAKAQELKGVMDDVNSSLSGGSAGPKDYGEHWANIQRNAEQTYAKFEGVQKVSAGVASGFAAIQGAAALLGDENEDLQKALLKVQSAMAIAQGIGGIKDLFEGLKQLKAAFTFTTTATKASTVATTANNAATAASAPAFASATAGATGFTAALHSMKTALVSTGIGALVVGLGMLIAYWDDISDIFSSSDQMVDELANDVDKLKEHFEALDRSIRFDKRLAEAAGAAKRELLQMDIDVAQQKVNKAKALSEKAQAAYDNAGYFEKEAAADALTAALTAEADAMKELISARQELIVFDQERALKPGAISKRAVAEMNDVADAWSKGVISKETYYERIKSIAQSAIDEIVSLDGALNSLDLQLIANLKKNVTDAENGLAAIKKTAGGSSQNSTDISTLKSEERRLRTTNTFMYSEGIIDASEYYKREISVMQKYLDIIKNNWHDATEEEKQWAQQLKNDLDAANKKLNELNSKVDLSDPEQLYQKLSSDANAIKFKYEIGLLTKPEAQAEIDKINKQLAEHKLNPLKINLDGESTNNNIPARGKTIEWRDYQSQQANRVEIEYKAGIITYGVAKQAIDEINADLEQLGLKPLELKIDDGSLAAFQERYESTMSVMDGSASVISSVGQAFGAVVSAINDENTALGAVVGTLDQGAKSWLEWGVNSVNTIAQVLPQIASIIMAQQAQALAGGIASGAALPFPANMAVIASVVAALLAMFASLPKFATGGIVNGSLIGDMNLARVNGGEMILNGRQQTNLFRMLDQNRLPQFSGGAADVNFRIKGDTLIGVIDNYNKKHGRG